jgi:hypothetical protein
MLLTIAISFSAGSTLWCLGNRLWPLGAFCFSCMVFNLLILLGYV